MTTKDLKCAPNASERTLQSGAKDQQDPNLYVMHAVFVTPNPYYTNKTAAFVFASCDKTSIFISLSFSLVHTAKMDTSSSAILSLYHSYVVPHLTKRNKIIGISAAITVSLCYMIRDRMLKPPKNLRHLPYHTHYQVLRSILSGESYWDRSYRLTIPQIDDKESNGIYVVRISCVQAVSSAVGK